MKLWLLFQNTNTDYDTYDGLVVAAETEEEARLIRPQGSWEDDYTSYSWVKHPYQVKVTYLGEAASDITEKQIILASFHAG